MVINVTEVQPGRAAAAPPDNAGGRESGAKRRRFREMTWWQPVIVFFVLIGLWYIASVSFAARGLGYFVPFPHQVFYAMLFDPLATSVIYPDLLNSIAVAMTGLGVAVVIGVIWAVLMAQAKWAERSLFPYAVLLQTIPILAITPLVGIIIGYSFGGRVVVTVLISLFPIVANTLFGLQSTDRAQRELFKLQGASRWTLLTKLQFPAAMPSIVVGLRNSAGLSVIGAVVGDQLLGQGAPGLGVAIQVFVSRVAEPQAYAAIVVAALFGIAVFLVFGLVGRLAVGKWFDLG